MRAVLGVLRVVLCLCALQGLAPADALVSGGVCPSGQYEVRLWTDPLWDPADFEVRIFDAHAGRWMPGTDRLQDRDRKEKALEGMVALWAPDGGRVVLWDREGLGFWLLWMEEARIRTEPIPPLSGDWKVDWPLCWEFHRVRIRVTRVKPGAGTRETAERWLDTDGGWRWEKE